MTEKHQSIPPCAAVPDDTRGVGPRSPDRRAEADGLRSRGERTTTSRGGPRPRPEHDQRNEGREPAVPIGTGAFIAADPRGEAGRSAGPTVADYLDGLRYRRHSRSVLLERRRLLGHALVCRFRRESERLDDGDLAVTATEEDFRYAARLFAELHT